MYDHIGLKVKDLNVALRFYSSILQHSRRWVM